MTKNLLCAVAVVAVLLLGCGNQSSPPAGQATTAPPQSAAASDFTLKTIKGDSMQLSTSLNKGPVVLIVTKTECATSRAALPKYNVFQTHYAASGPLTVLTILQNPQPTIEGYVKELDLKMPVAEDAPPYKVSSALQIRATPTVLLLNKDGTVAAKAEGWNRDQANALAQEAAKLAGVPYKAVSEDGDGMPKMMPG
jgi:peroxiredoxin